MYYLVIESVNVGSITTQGLSVLRMVSFRGGADEKSQRLLKADSGLPQPPGFLAELRGDDASEQVGENRKTLDHDRLCSRGGGELFQQSIVPSLMYTPRYEAKWTALAEARIGVFAGLRSTKNVRARRQVPRNYAFAGKRRNDVHPLGH